MRSWVFALSAAALLVACGGNPFTTAGGGGGGGGTPALAVDPKVARDLNSASYNGTDLRINLTGLISSGPSTLFVRAPSLDITSAGNGQPNYLAFTYQETALQRSYVAFVATNQRGNLLAVQASDGGQFNEHNDGGYVTRTGTYTRPAPVEGVETGQFSYIGNYAGLFVPGFTDDLIRPPNLRPAAPIRVQGIAQINVRFENGTTRSGLVEGQVTNRILLDDTGARITSLSFSSGTTVDFTDQQVYPDLVLRGKVDKNEIGGVVDTNGRFLGDVEYYGSPNSPVGNYGGLFGGLDASDVAGVLWVNPVRGNNGLWEHGVFNLPRCDQAGAASLCTPRTP